MLLEPRSIALFCGMGTHAKSIYHFMHKYAIRKIYIILSKSNTPEIEHKIEELKEEIRTKVVDLDHDIQIVYIAVPHTDFLKSFQTIYDTLKKEINNDVIVDITGGRKIVSYSLHYAYSHFIRNFRGISKLVYFYEEEEVVRELPLLNVESLNDKLTVFLRRIWKYWESPVRNRSLTAYLVDRSSPIDECADSGLPKTTFEPYNESTLHRYRKILKRKGYITGNGTVTVLGKMYIHSNNG